MPKSAEVCLSVLTSVYTIWPGVYSDVCRLDFVFVCSSPHWLMCVG